MLRQALLSEIAASEAKIIATDESKTFSKEYKDQRIAQEKAFILQLKGEIVDYDRLTDQSKG